ncbi:hypothetical protein ACFL6K_05330 [Candidatus Latescibacterota bacterium]
MLKKIFSLYLSLYLVIFGMLPAIPAHAQDGKVFTIAVLDMTAKGVSQVEAEVLSERLRSHISQLIASPLYTEMEDMDQYLVVEQTQIDKIFEQFEIQNIGCVSDSCAIEFGKMLQVDRIVLGQIGYIGNTFSVSSRIIDVESGKSIASADRQHKGSIDDIMSTVINEVGDELMGLKKKSKLKWYILGGLLIAGAGAGAAMMGGGDSSDPPVMLPYPPDRP